MISYNHPAEFRLDIALEIYSGPKQFKMVDLGTAIRVQEAKNPAAGPAMNQSLMTFTQMKFAG